MTLALPLVSFLVRRLNGCPRTDAHASLVRRRRRRGLFWASVACCALAQFFILRSVGGGGRRHVPAHIAHLPRQRGAMEVLWAVVPAIALAVLLAFTWRAIRAAPTGVQGTAPAVEVVR